MKRIAFACIWSFAALSGVSAQVSTIGCSTPSSNTVYFTPFAQTCLGASVIHSETTLINLHNTNALPVAGIACVAATAGTLRYKDGSMEFCNGSAWTSLGTGSGAATAADRISTTNVVSGGSLGMVVANNGTISFTTGGVAGTAYLDSIGRYIGPGVSITTLNGVSSTNGYFSGNVGVGTSAPTATLDVSGSVNIKGNVMANGVTGMIFGGTYSYYRSGNASCPGSADGVRSNNPLTGGQSCPSGFTSYADMIAYDSINTNCLIICYK